MSPILPTLPPDMWFHTGRFHGLTFVMVGVRAKRWYGYRTLAQTAVSSARYAHPEEAIEAAAAYLVGLLKERGELPE